MNRKTISLLIIGLLVLIITSLSGCTPVPTNTSADGQVTVIIDEVIRSDVLPADTAEALSSASPPRDAPTPALGNDLVIVYLSIECGEEVSMIAPFPGFVMGEAGLTLLDAEGHEYEPVRDLFDTYYNAQDLRFESAEGFLVFELPRQQEPARLRLVYIYEKVGEEDNQRGEINIDL